MKENDYNNTIIQMLKRYSFDTKFDIVLDLLRRSDQDILFSFMKFIQHEAFLASILLDFKRKVGLIVCGDFGRAFINNYYDTTFINSFNDVLIVNENVKKGAIPELLVNNLPSDDYIFIDASMYTGETIDRINKALKKIDSSKGITQTYVIYDGNYEVKDDVASMFKYYYNRPLS